MLEPYDRWWPCRPLLQAYAFSWLREALLKPPQLGAAVGRSGQDFQVEGNCSVVAEHLLAGWRQSDGEGEPAGGTGG